MMEREGQIRREVMSEILRVMVEAQQAGRDPWREAERVFPGTPTSVIAAAWVDLESATEAAWWDAVERTIDGKVVRNAIAVANLDQGGAE